MQKRKLIAGLLLLLAPLALGACSSSNSIQPTQQTMTKAQMEDSVVKASDNLQGGSLDERMNMNFINVPIKYHILGDFRTKPTARMTGIVDGYTPDGKQNGKHPFAIQGDKIKTKINGKWHVAKAESFGADDYKKPLNLIAKKDFRDSAQYKYENGMIHMNMTLNKQQRQEVMDALKKTDKSLRTNNVYAKTHVDKAQVTEVVNPRDNKIIDTRENLKLSSRVLTYDNKVHLSNIN